MSRGVRQCGGEILSLRGARETVQQRSLRVTYGEQADVAREHSNSMVCNLDRRGIAQPRIAILGPPALTVGVSRYQGRETSLSRRSW